MHHFIFSTKDLINNITSKIYMVLQLYNTLTRKKELFKQIKKSYVGIYTCGPTVYDYAHIGNLRTYIFENLLKCILLFNKYKVKHVMNITDVGHLVSDADTGEDKIEKGAKREGKTVWDIADFYTKQFLQDMRRLNLLYPDILCKATDHIKEQLSLVYKLEKKGYTYTIKDGVYFDTSKLKDYGKLANLNIEGLKPGARVEIVHGKKNITDFALWKFSPKNQKRQMQWDSKFGAGFPGWHLECSAMSMKYLGNHFDIHCGGIDHIQIHHTNEIAQTEALTGKKWVNFWLHGEFVMFNSHKMSKSLGNYATLNTLIEEDYDPLDFKFLCLGTHYRTPLNFTYEALDSAKTSFNHLKDRILEIKGKLKETNGKSKTKKYKKKFLDAINDDLNIPQALAVLWEVLKTNELGNKEKYLLALEFDRIFGLSLHKISRGKLTKETKSLIKQREKARLNQDWELADKIRDKLKEKGVILEDTEKGTRYKTIT